MPEMIACPNCHRQLRVPDSLLGKTVKCPDCKEKFAATIATNEQGEEAPSSQPGSSHGVTTGRRPKSRRGSAAEEMEYDEDHPPQPYDDLDEGEEDERLPTSGTSKKAGWRSVRLGLNLMIYGIYGEIAGVALFLLCAIVFGILVAVAGASLAAVPTLSSNAPNKAGAASAGGAAFAGVVILIVGYGLLVLSWLAHMVLSVTGHVFFLWIPDKPGTGRRPLAITSLCLWSAGVLLPFVSIGLNCLGGFANSSRGGSSGGEFMGLFGSCFNLIGGLCQIAWFFVFLFFLRSVVLAMGNRALARQLITYMIAAPVSGVMAFVGMILTICLGGAAVAGFAGASKNAQNTATAGVGLIIFIFIVYGLILLLFVALWIWYIVLLHKARGSIKAKYLN